MNLRARLLTGVLLTLIGLPVRADAYIEKQLTTHCGALLLAAASGLGAAQDDFKNQLGRLAITDDSVDGPEAAYADVQTLDLPGYGDPVKLEVSDARLARLSRDLDRAPAILSVAFVTRGAAVAAFLDRLNSATETLDREVQRQTAALTFDGRRALVETLAAAVIFVGGTQIAAAVPGTPFGLVAQTAGLVGSAYVARGPASRAWNAFFPAGLLDLRRVQLDSHLRIVHAAARGAPGPARAHIGLSVEVSSEMVATLLDARAWTDLDVPRWAQLLARGARTVDEVPARVLVDHVSFTDAGEPVLLSAVRLIRPAPRPTVRRRDPLDHRARPPRPYAGVSI